MKPVEVVTFEERLVWMERQAELRKHKLVKCNYYPNRVDEWEEKNKEIMREYNVKMQELNKDRKEQKTTIEENKKEPIRRSGRIADSLKQSEEIAVEALLLLRTVR